MQDPGMLLCSNNESGLQNLQSIGSRTCQTVVVTAEQVRCNFSMVGEHVRKGVFCSALQVVDVLRSSRAIFFDALNRLVEIKVRNTHARH